MSPDLSKGYVCKCGAYHTYPMYLYAHWYERIEHTCDGCGRIWSLREGHKTIKLGPSRTRAKLARETA